MPTAERMSIVLMKARNLSPPLSDWNTESKPISKYPVVDLYSPLSWIRHYVPLWLQKIIRTKKMLFKIWNRRTIGHTEAFSRALALLTQPVLYRQTMYSTQLDLRSFITFNKYTLFSCIEIFLIPATLNTSRSFFDNLTSADIWNHSYRFFCSFNRSIHQSCSFIRWQKSEEKENVHKETGA